MNIQINHYNQLTPFVPNMTMIAVLVVTHAAGRYTFQTDRMMSVAIEKVVPMASLVQTTAFHTE